VVGIAARSGHDAVAFVAEALAATSGASPPAWRARVGPLALTVAAEGFAPGEAPLALLRYLSVAPDAPGGLPWHVTLLGPHGRLGPPPTGWPFPIHDPAGFHRTLWAPDHGLALASDEGHGVWSLADLPARRALLWMADPSRLPEWEITQPLRHAVHWAAIASGAVLAHGAAFGTAEAQVLVTGPGGTGKSTLTAGAVAAGFDVLAEDLCWVDLAAPGPRACRLYDSIKLTPESVLRFTAAGRLAAGAEPFAKLTARLPAPDAPHGPLKALLCLGGRFAETPSARPIAKSRAYALLAPSTLFLMRTATRETAARLRRLVEALPAFELVPGRDPAATAAFALRLAQAGAA
jgi:hypothetical protein